MWTRLYLGRWLSHMVGSSCHHQISSPHLNQHHQLQSTHLSFSRTVLSRPGSSFGLAGSRTKYPHKIYQYLSPRVAITSYLGKSQWECSHHGDRWSHRRWRVRKCSFQLHQFGCPTSWRFCPNLLIWLHFRFPLRIWHRRHADCDQALRWRHS